MEIKKPVKVKATAKRKVAPEKKDLVEQKLSSVVDSPVTEQKAFAANNFGSAGFSQKSFPLWGLVFAILILVLSTMLLYEYNKDFRSNFSNLLNSTGIIKMNTDGKEVAKPAVASTIKMSIVYNKEEANQKQSIDQYLQNIEKNLENTKVEAIWLDKNSDEGKTIIDQLSAKYLPIFTTDETVKKHPQYSLFAPALKEVNGVFQFASEGLEYLTVPPIGDARIIGAKPDNAKVVIIEYGSLTCRFCQTMQPILNKIVKANSSEISWVIKMFDRGGVDLVLSQAAECAADQNKFGGMMDAIYDKQADVKAALQDPKDPQAAVYKIIKAAAKEAGANGDEVIACVEAGTYAEKVAKDTAEGQSFGITGTPSFFINKQFVGGALDEAAFTKMVEDELNK